MRWSTKGAQAILDLMAVSINGDMEEFMKVVPKFEQRNLLREVA